MWRPVTYLLSVLEQKWIGLQIKFSFFPPSWLLLVVDVRSRRALGHLCRRKTGLKVISLTDGDISCSPLIIYHGNKLIANYKMAGAGIVKRAHMRSVSEPALRVSCGGYSRERTRLTDLAYERGKDNVAHWIGAWSFEEVRQPFLYGGTVEL